MTAPLYALWGDLANSYLTFHGRVIVHGDRAELEHLFPKQRVVPVPDGLPADELFWLRHHPDMADVTFPLQREDFRA